MQNRVAFGKNFSGGIIFCWMRNKTGSSGHYWICFRIIYLVFINMYTNYCIKKGESY